MRCRFPERVLRDDRGGVAAEFAVTLPAVLLVLALAAGAMSAQAQRILLQDATADASRIIARGEDPSAAAAHLARVVAGAAMRVDAGETVCVTATVQRSVAFIPLSLSATSCALGGGR